MVVEGYLQDAIRLVHQIGESPPFGEVTDEAQRRRLYLRLLLSRYRDNRPYVVALESGVWRHRRSLRLLLGLGPSRPPQALARARPVSQVMEAVLFDTDGLSSPAAIQRLWAEVASHCDASAAVGTALHDAEAIARESGLSAPWGPGAVLAAWLRHIALRTILPPGLRPRLIDPWPASSRMVRDTTQQVAIEVGWDPAAETRSSARARIFAEVERRLGGLLDESVRSGHSRTRARDIRRDVEATFLRITDPERWGWERLARHFGYAGPHRSQKNEGNSPTAVKRAVMFTLELLEIEPPPKGPGRPPQR